jgi:hypothetical protein
MQCLQDRRFYSIAGAQWEGPLGEQFENKPKFEFNKVHLAVIRIINEYRNNRITVDFTPKDGAEDKLADTCDGLYRADEKACTAEEAYDNGFEEASAAAMAPGACAPVYEDEETTTTTGSASHGADLRRRLVRVLRPRRQAPGQGRREALLRADALPDGLRGGVRPRPDDLAEGDHAHGVRLGHARHRVGGRAVPRRGDESQTFTSSAAWTTAQRHEGARTPSSKPTRSCSTSCRRPASARCARSVVKRRRVHKYILSGLKIEDDGELHRRQVHPGHPFYGKRWVVDGVERCMGHVRLAKDAQRLMNTLLSWLAEMAGRFDIEKPIFTPEQIAGHATMWARDNIDRSRTCWRTR